jgi:hypothetical protein
MRAGKLVHKIWLHRLAPVLVDEFGQVRETWDQSAELMAEKVENRMGRAPSEAGPALADEATFRIRRARWIDVNPGNRAMVQERDRVETYEILEVVEIDRRRGMELRCRRLKTSYAMEPAP